MYLWLGGNGKGKFFEEKEDTDKMDMEEILEEMEWISEMFGKIDDKTVKEKKDEENL